MVRFKTLHVYLLLGLFAPACGFASNYCIAVNGGFGNGGTTFIELGHSLPAAGNCTPWAGFTKTASTVILTTSGTWCVSTDGKALTVSVSSADPSFLGAGKVGSDYMQFFRTISSNPFSSGQDVGAFGGSAKPVTCTTNLLRLPSTHD